MSKNTLYLVAGERNIAVSEEGNDLITYANVGQTEITVAERLKNQDYRRKAAGGSWLNLYEWDIGPYRDKDIHPLIEELGYIKNPSNTSNTEEFDFQGIEKNELINIISTIVNKLKYGVERPDNYSMRPEQKEAHDKIISAFHLGYDSFLVAALMRFGKVFLTYNVMKTINANNVLVLSARPNDVLHGWKSGLERHVEFKDWNFNEIKDISSFEEIKTQKNVFFVSTQYLMNESGSSNKDWVYQLPTDLLVFDEEHHGSKTSKALEIIKRFNPKKRIALSGTPYRSLTSGEYGEDNTFLYDKPMLKPNFFGISLDKRVKELSNNNGFVGPDGFNINKFFSAVNDEFVFRHDVERIMKAIFIPDGFDKERYFFSPFNIRKVIDQKCLDHIIIRLETIAACKAMQKMLKSFLPKEWDIILAAGSESGVITDGDEIISKVKRSKKSITITCGRFSTGITVPKWGSVFKLHGGRSIVDYYQMSYRPSSESGDKEWDKREFYVFDFEPNRVLELAYQRSFFLKKKSETIKKSLDDYLDCANIFLCEENSWQTIDSKKVMEYYEAEVSRRDLGTMISSDIGIDTTKIGSANFGFLSHILSQKGNNLDESFSMNSNDLEKGQVTKQGKKNLANKNRESEQEKIKKIKNVLKRIPNVIIEGEYSDLDSLLNDKEIDEYFTRCTGISLENYKELIDSGVLDSSWQNNSITRIYNVYETIRPEF